MSRQAKEHGSHSARDGECVNSGPGCAVSDIIKIKTEECSCTCTKETVPRPGCCLQSLHHTFKISESDVDVVLTHTDFHLPEAFYIKSQCLVKKVELRLIVSWTYGEYGENVNRYCHEIKT